MPAGEAGPSGAKLRLDYGRQIRTIHRSREQRRWCLTGDVGYLLTGFTGHGHRRPGAGKVREHPVRRLGGCAADHVAVRRCRQHGADLREHPLPGMRALLTDSVHRHGGGEDGQRRYAGHLLQIGTHDRRRDHRHDRGRGTDHHTGVEHNLAPATVQTTERHDREPGPCDSGTLPLGGRHAELSIMARTGTPDRPDRPFSTSVYPLRARVAGTPGTDVSGSVLSEHLDALTMTVRGEPTRVPGTPGGRSTHAGMDLRDVWRAAG